MTDESWRRGRGDPEPRDHEFDDVDDEFGVVRFADDGATDAMDREPGAPGLSFRAGDTGSLPHWTAPPSGDVPRTAAPGDPEAWSSFADGADADMFADADHMGRPPVSREQARIQIGTDPTDERTRARRADADPKSPRAPRAARPPSRSARTKARPASAEGRPAGRGTGRDMPTAIAVGLLIIQNLIHGSDTLLRGSTN